MPHVVCAYGEVGHEALAELLDLDADVGLVVTHEDAPGENVQPAEVVQQPAVEVHVPEGGLHRVQVEHGRYP